MLEGIEVRPDIRCAEHDLFAHLDGQLRLQLLFIFLALLDSLGNHVSRLSCLQCFPEVLDGRIRFPDGGLDALDGDGVPVGFAGFRYRSGNPLNIAVGQQLPALQHHPVLDLFFADHFLLALAALEVIAGIVVIYLAGLPGAAVAGHHLPAVAAEQLGGEQIFIPPSGAGRRFLVAV